MPLGADMLAHLGLAAAMAVNGREALALLERKPRATGRGIIEALPAGAVYARAGRPFLLHIMRRQCRYLLTAMGPAHPCAGWVAAAAPLTEVEWSRRRPFCRQRACPFTLPRVSSSRPGREKTGMSPAALRARMRRLDELAA